MIATFIIILTVEVLLVLLAAVLRHLDFSRLQARFPREAYGALVDELERRDDVALCAEGLSIFCASASTGFLAAMTHTQELWVVVPSFAVAVGLLHVALPWVVVAPRAESLLVEIMPLYRLMESIPLCSLAGTLRRLGLGGVAGGGGLRHEMERLLSEGEADGELGRRERQILRRVARLGKTQVRDIMTPRVDLVTLREGSLVRDGLMLGAQHGLSRLPIYDAPGHEVKGVFFVRDVLKDLAQGSQVLSEKCEEHMRQVPQVPETRDLSSLLGMLGQSRNQMVLVHDEFGSLSGVITLEDILEEFVGEIRDEYVDREPRIRELPGGELEVPAQMRLDDLRERLSWPLPQLDNAETLAGAVLHVLQRIPERGESVVIAGRQVTVVKATSRRITLLRVTPVKN
ncbi:MAG: hemolysin family protein [Planctomycetota bacterium]